MLAKGSGPFVGGACLLSLSSAMIVYVAPSPLAVTLMLMSFVPLLFVPYFFRDPEREIGEGAVSPADGKVISVDQNGSALHVAIFMNVHDVHVNRAPVDCVVGTRVPKGAGFRMAFEPGSNTNVRLEWGLETSYGTVVLHQITGWFARRIVPYVAEGRPLRKGERMGMIRFGSRVDVWLPKSAFKPSVAVGERVKAGTTTIAVLAERKIT